MAITAKFEADFTQFRGAVDSASGTLKTFEAGVGNVGTGLRLVSSRSEETTPKVRDLHGAMQQFDGVLASMGVHIGPEIRALGELGEVSGKSASQIGAIGTAGLALGAALGGWKIGRLIADFFDLDEMIGKATASLLGLGDVAAQEAGAGMDVLARASTLAGRAVTDFAEAQQIIITKNAEFQASMNTSEFRTSQWRLELDKVAKGGSLEVLRLELASHNSTLQELSKEYGVSVRALEAFQRSSAATAEAQSKDTALMVAATAKLHAAQERLNFLGEGWKTTLATIDPLTTTAIQNYLALGAAQSDLAIKFSLSALQIKAVAQGMEEQTLIMGLTEPKLGSLTEFVTGATKATEDWRLELGLTDDSLKDIGATIDAVIPKVDALDAALPSGSGAASRGISSASVSAGDTTNEERMMGWAAQGAIVDQTTTAYQSARTPSLFRGSPSGGGGVNVPITINGSVLGNQADIARMVGDAVMAALRGAGTRLPTGA